MLIKLSNKNILFLEDDLNFIEYASNFFRLFFKNIFIAHNIKEAMGILEDKNIDLIISDIHLKNENGLDFIREFREDNQSTPIIVISGHKDEHLLFSAMTLNLCGYLLKPLSYENIIEILETCIKKMDFNSNKIINLKNGFLYDKNLKVILKDEETIELNEKEILFFEMIAENINRVITRDMFEFTVWKSEEMSDSALNNFVSRIRKKFGKDFLHTIPNIGYKVLL